MSEHGAQDYEHVWPPYNIQEDIPDPAYISICRTCGGMTGACVDELDRRSDVAVFVGNVVRAGDIVQRGTATDVRTMAWCTCVNDAGQPTLFTTERLAVRL